MGLETKEGRSRENGGTGGGTGLRAAEAGGWVADLKKASGKRLARYDGS